MQFSLANTRHREALPLEKPGTFIFQEDRLKDYKTEVYDTERLESLIYFQRAKIKGFGFIMSGRIYILLEAKLVNEKKIH